jgi:antitoxin (DNA-binding transcriptional repressor) of toxin-antitoxin stability system
MKKLNIREIRNALPHLDQLLEREGQLTITRRGEEIARISPVVRRAIPSHRKLRESMPRMKKPSQKLIRDDRDAR